MDLWIMGLLYELIVRGSRLHGAFGEKGLVRSVYPTGGMRGRTPALSLGVWRGKKRRGWGWEIGGNLGGGKSKPWAPPTAPPPHQRTPPPKKKNRPEIYAEG